MIYVITATLRVDDTEKNAFDALAMLQNFIDEEIEGHLDNISSKIELALEKAKKETPMLAN